MNKTDIKELRGLIRRFLLKTDERARKIIKPNEQEIVTADQVTAGISIFYFEEAFQEERGRIQYRWSSYHANALGSDDILMTPHQQRLSLGKNQTSRCREYRALFAEQPSESVLKTIGYANKKGLPFGSDPFSGPL